MPRKVKLLVGLKGLLQAEMWADEKEYQFADYWLGGSEYLTADKKDSRRGGSTACTKVDKMAW